LSEISGSDILNGPRETWTYHKGAWGNLYNGTREPLPDIGPFALLDGPASADVSISGRIRLAAGCVIGAVQLRTQSEDGYARGLSVVFDPIAGEVRLVESPGAPGDSAQEAQRLVLARTPVELLPDTWMDFELQAEGRRVTVELQGRRLLDEQVELVQPGQVGVIQWGEDLALDELVVDGAERSEPRQVLPDPSPGPESRALESLCLALLNTNEFLTID
jgi:hypothetical protein